MSSEQVGLSAQEQLFPGESILEKWEFALSAGFEGYLAMECAVRGDAHTVFPEVARSMRAQMGQ